MIKSENNKKCEKAITMTANSTIQTTTLATSILQSKPMKSTLRRSSSSLENTNFTSLLQSTLNHNERHSHSLVNLYYKNIENQQQSSMKLTNEMPIRTTKIKATKTKSNSTKNIKTNCNDSILKSKLNNEFYDIPSELTTRLSRSHSEPIIEIDRFTRERLHDDNRSINIDCNKNFDSFNRDRQNGANQKQEQEKIFNDEYTNMKTSSKSTINIMATTMTLATTETTRITTPIRLRKSSMIIETGDDIAKDNDRQITAHHNQQRDDLRFGCAHYKRRAMFVTPCCSKFYKCRFCHDENETHHFDRKTLNELICSECNTRQKVQEACGNCGVRFGKYICLICNLFDDEDKKQYHCNACGICRIGGAENFFHCEVCNMCLPIQLKIDGHKCVENISRSHCPVCLGDIHTSRIPCHIPDCGHLLHKMCFDQLLASGHYACPTCQTSLIDMTALWDFLDRQAEQMPLPKKYENHKIQIFCNDCQRTSKTSFHFIGLKCMECGAYNTTNDVKRRVSLVSDELNTA